MCELLSTLVCVHACVSIEIVHRSRNDFFLCVCESVKPSSSKSQVQKHFNDLSMCDEIRGREVLEEMSGRGEGENGN